jgi:hypothetical protein
VRKCECQTREPTVPAKFLGGASLLSRRWPSRQIRRVEKVIGRNVYRRLWSVVAQREESRRTGSLGETGAGIWMQNFDDTLSVCSKGKNPRRRPTAILISPSLFRLALEGHAANRVNRHVAGRQLVRVSSLMRVPI